MQKFSIALALALATVLGPLTTGCSMLKKKPPTAKAFYWDLVFQRVADKDFSATVFDLDVFGADEALKRKVETAGAGAYFAYNSELRREALTSGTTLVFGSGTDSQKLAKEHNLYKQWNSGTSAKPAYLVFVANLPGGGSGSGRDGRILAIDYDSKRFPKSVRSKKLLQIEITSSQIKSPMLK